jgi:hypothetical protein
MRTDRSLDALLEFLDAASDSGWLRSATAQSLKTAATRVLGTLSEREARDLSNVDIDDAFERFASEAGEDISAASLGAYKQRARRAVDIFLEYLRDPSSLGAPVSPPPAPPAPAFRQESAPQNGMHTSAHNGTYNGAPYLAQSTPDFSPRTPVRSAGLDATPPRGQYGSGAGLNGVAAHASTATLREPATADSAGGLNYPFPLRPDATIVLSRIPRDLKMAEVERITGFLRSLATDYSPR